jgi:hypothetical protein
MSPIDATRSSNPTAATQYQEYLQRMKETKAAERQQDADKTEAADKNSPPVDGDQDGSS